MNLDSWYKSLVESNKEIPPESVWEGVQDALDIDLVWTRVEGELGGKRKKNYLYIYAIAASLFIAMSIGVWLFFFSIKSLERENFANQQPPKIDEKENVVKNTSIQPIQPEVKADRINAKRTVNPKSDPIKELKAIPDDNDTISDTEVALNQINPIESKIIAHIFIHNEPSLNELVEKDNSLDIPTKPFIELAYLGFTGQMANTWLMSSKTLLGLQPEELTTTNISFGKNIGVQLGAKISSRFMLQSEFFWINQNKQEFNEYVFGNYVTTALELNYYTSTLLAKYQINKSKKHQFLFGGYASLMQSAKQKVGSTVSSIFNEYSNFDYGLIVGYEYPIALRNRLVFSPGFSINAGLKNIFDGNEYLPTHLNRTQNLSLNLTFSVSYNIF
jgi:hypothetical protein